jgi:hypothetical protein
VDLGLEIMEGFLPIKSGMHFFENMDWFDHENKNESSRTKIQQLSF